MPVELFVGRYFPKSINTEKKVTPKEQSSNTTEIASTACKESELDTECTVSVQFFIILFELTEAGTYNAVDDDNIPYGK